MPCRIRTKDGKVLASANGDREETTWESRHQVWPIGPPILLNCSRTEPPFSDRVRGPGRRAAELPYRPSSRADRAGADTDARSPEPGARLFNAKILPTRLTFRERDPDRG
jgi:hypothetical protein